MLTAITLAGAWCAGMLIAYALVAIHPPDDLSWRSNPKQLSGALSTKPDAPRPHEPATAKTRDLPDGAKNPCADKAVSQRDRVA